MSKYSYRGLTDAEVESSRNEHGPNSLPPPETETFMEKLMENFDVRLRAYLALLSVESPCVSACGALALGGG